MTNPTVNRAYDMPASTDLVTNLPADFAIFGDAVDLDISSRGGYTTTATAAGTTVLTVTSNRNQRFTGVTTQTVTMPVASTLAVGARWKIQNKSTGIVTVQSSGANTIYAIPAGATIEIVCILASGTTAASWDYDWAGASSAPAASGMVLLKRASFAGVANTGTTFDGFFTSAYTDYLVIVEDIFTPGSTSAQLQMQMMYSGTLQTSGYYGTAMGWDAAGTVNNRLNNGTTTFSFTYNYVNSAIDAFLSLRFSGVGNGSATATWSGTGLARNSSVNAIIGGQCNVARAYTGFQFLPSTATLTGTISIYGLAIA